MSNKVQPRHPHLLRRDDTVVIAVDLQESLLRLVHQPEALTKRLQFILSAAQILGIPVIATTQNVGRLGGIPEDLASVLYDAEATIIDKMTFSCCGSDQFLHTVQRLGRKQALIIGVETHICIAQTAMDLTTYGYQSHVAADAVSSRTLELHKLGMERIRDSAVLPCAAEAAIYELLGEAGTPEFRAILPLVK